MFSNYAYGRLGVFLSIILSYCVIQNISLCDCASVGGKLPLWYFSNSSHSAVTSVDPSVESHNSVNHVDLSVVSHNPSTSAAKSSKKALIGKVLVAIVCAIALYMIIPRGIGYVKAFLKKPDLPYTGERDLGAGGKGTGEGGGVEDKNKPAGGVEDENKPAGGVDETGKKVEDPEGGKGPEGAAGGMEEEEVEETGPVNLQESIKQVRRNTMILESTNPDDPDTASIFDKDQVQTSTRWKNSMHQKAMEQVNKEYGEGLSEEQIIKLKEKRQKILDKEIIPRLDGADTTLLKTACQKVMIDIKFRQMMGTADFSKAIVAVDKMFDLDQVPRMKASYYFKDVDAAIERGAFPEHQLTSVNAVKNIFPHLLVMQQVILPVRKELEKAIETICKSDEELLAEIEGADGQ